MPTHPPDLSQERALLAERQAKLVSALVAGGASPDGFDAARVALTARTLVNKRLREVARAWPELVAALGARFAARFTEFATSHPPPEVGGPLVDGHRFGRWLPSAERSDEAEVRLLQVELRQRRWCGVCWGRLPQSGGVVIGVRVLSVARVWVLGVLRSGSRGISTRTGA